MSFPYTYSDKISFSEKQQNPNDIKNSTERELINTYHFSPSENNKSQLFKVNSPFLKIPFSFELSVNTTEINYTIHLDQLLKIILIVIIFSALFSYASLGFFFWFASLFSVFFYILNIMIMNGYVRSVLSKILKTNKLSVTEQETFSKEQEEWMNDKNRCPACGYFLSDIDLVCPDCGLHLKRSRHTIPLDTSKYKNNPVKYHYKKK